LLRDVLAYYLLMISSLKKSKVSAQQITRLGLDKLVGGFLF
jgi:hypothetical protein